jgi:RNA polymerase sigma-70 factor (sigma-E family)
MTLWSVMTLGRGERVVHTEPIAGRQASRTTLEDLYVRHMPTVRATAYLLTGDRSVAEDLAQEAFLRMIGRFQHLRSPDAFEAYLRRTVVNLSLNHLRHRRVERAHLDRERGRPEPELLPPDPAVRDELWESLLRLPARRRAAIVLRYYADLPERQVAEILGCSQAAAHSLVARGMESLRAWIRGDNT